MYLADDPGKFIEGLVAGLDEGRYPLTVPIERSKSCIEHRLKMVQLPRQQARFHFREATYQGIVILQHEIHILDVLVVLVFLKRHVESGLRNLPNIPVVGCVRGYQTLTIGRSTLERQ